MTVKQKTPVEDANASQFVPETEYTFVMKSFRPRNGFMFATVQDKSKKTLDLLIGQAADFRLADLLELKRAEANIVGLFKEYKEVGRNTYPRFWNVSFS